MHMKNNRSIAIAFTWQMLLEEMRDIEVGTTVVLQILREAKRHCDSANISLEQLIDFAQETGEELRGWKEILQL